MTVSAHTSPRADSFHVCLFNNSPFLTRSLPQVSLRFFLPLDLPRKDMRIRLWSPKMEAGATFDMSAFGPCPIVHSVCLSSDGTKLLVGVKGCEVRCLDRIKITYITELRLRESQNSPNMHTYM